MIDQGEQASTSSQGCQKYSPRALDHCVESLAFSCRDIPVKARDFESEQTGYCVSNDWFGRRFSRVVLLGCSAGISPSRQDDFICSCNVGGIEMS
jgi:hypothetical protein